MAAKKKVKADKKLLSAWEPPEGAGRPVGCLATTFTFSSVFFEEECLSRFLQMQSDAIEDGPVYIIEREEKLVDVCCAAVLADACHCKGSRSLRWDLLAARLPKAILHAKISLLCWLNQVRVIIASSNLTEDGYRRNREIFGCVDFYEGSDASLGFLDDITAFLKQALTYAQAGGKDTDAPASERCNNFLTTLEAMSRNWGHTSRAGGKKNVRVHAIMTGHNRPDIFEQVAGLWPEGTPPGHAYVTSPFFDSTGHENHPAKALWRSLRQRGETSVTYNIVADTSSEENLVVLRAPRELLAAEPTRKATTTRLCTINEQDDDTDAPLRPLHLKSIWFKGKDWHGYLIGSGNFTSNGLGFAKTPNLEANILYLVSQAGNPKALKALKQSCLKGTPLDKNLKIIWEPRSDKGEDAPDQVISPLAAAFDTAVFFRQEGQAFVRFAFSGKPPKGWKILWGNNADKKIFDEADWQKQQQPSSVELEWDETMAPSGFDVTWQDSQGRAWWPVNVDRATSLPPPAELKDLPLDLLINVLTSARPLHQVLQSWIKKKAKGNDDYQGKAIVNPHKRVNTSAFLLKKTYRITAALSGLQDRLVRPAMSKDSVEWRLKGPVGVTAVKNAILKESCSIDEQVFLLTELSLALARVKPATAPGCLSVKDVQQQIRLILEELKTQTLEFSKDSPPALKKYVREAFREVKL